MGFVDDDNPLVGQLPDRLGAYFASGYTGHGMALAMAAGRAIAEQILGDISLPVPQILRPERLG